MSDIHAPVGEGHGPARFAIRVQGHLDARWSAWFDGLSVTTESNGTTLIEGLVPDQAVLFGLLHKMRDIGLPLLSVVRAEPEDRDGPTVDPR